MTIKTRYEIHANYAYIHCEGVFEQDAVLKIFSMAFDFAISKGLKGVLVDGRELQGAPPTTIERFFIGQHIAKVNIAQSRLGISIAVVGNDPIVEPGRLAEITAINRGASTKVFTSLDDGIAWLESKLLNK